MDVGIQMVFATYGWQGMRDDEAWKEEIRLARLADELGFDALWAVEHHFNISTTIRSAPTICS